MKQAVLIFFTTLLCGQHLRAQSDLDVTPNTVDANVDFDLSNTYDNLTFRVRLKNNARQTINLRWEIIVDEAPDGWRFSVCDQNTCYFTTNTTNVDFRDRIPYAPVIMLSGDSAKLELNIFPIGKAGSANIRINLYDLANPKVLLNTAYYFVTIDGLTPVTETDKNKLRIYPNPVSDYMTITRNTFVKQLWVSNILGKRVRTFDTSFGSKYDISDLPDGIYLVSMVDANRKVVKTVRISKRGIRP
ncbi:MAG: T9SS type A sorting domain-containing protein [Saprospiraceae bacterium]|nr:T9SS type A sorting domain-containing protein [Saprospiraceae bacterium]MCF8252511.1 T9SS type A sorting domain-containing protein [Saprospiraceae bacterium]MCF8282535.1 T9SS type A sorting domain-containing protein [Bacteroidales bacterium]MCF8314120.1 T9SS type A sorting domain-containing protein [Saprospiraceae bacterium]MCF8442865.1 T9SS type A sorting domain-containing protein [Saprospiraceae bacterium]